MCEAATLISNPVLGSCKERDLKWLCGIRVYPIRISFLHCILNYMSNLPDGSLLLYISGAPEEGAGNLPFILADGLALGMLFSPLFSCASKHDVSDWDVFNDRQSLASWKEVFWLCLDACVLGLRREVYGLLLSLGYKNRKNACPGWWWSHCCGPCSAEASPCGLNLTQEENTWVAGFN